MAVIDTKYRQRPRAMRRKLMRHGPTMVAQGLRALLWRLTHGLPPAFAPHPVPRTFFGVNCAPNPDPAWDEVYLRWIRELGVGSVRVDVTYDSDTEAFWRWAEALHAGGLDVVAHLVPPAAAAANMHTARGGADWEQFVTAILEPVKGKVSHAELGSTPNRLSWSGATISDVVAMHTIAGPILDSYGIRRVGPNVSDFAPYFNAALLGALRDRGLAPQVHSDNLFVDRAAVPPERPDWRALGRPLSPVVRLDLVKKIRWLAALSRWAGCGETWVTCFAWTLGQRKARHVDPATQAAYLARYYLLAAATGLVQRVFWSQLTSHLRGLIDDGHAQRYDPPEDVFLRRANCALPRDAAKRPAFHALAELTRLVAGAEFRDMCAEDGEITLRFARDNQIRTARWRIDGEPATPQWTTEGLSPPP